MTKSSNPVAFLDDEISRREAEVEALRAARDVLARTMPTGGGTKPPPLALPAPAKKRGRPPKAEAGAEEDGGNIAVINGKEIALTPKEMMVWEAFPDGGEDCVSLDALQRAACSPSNGAVYQLLKSINDKIGEAGAIIANVRGEGYRLEELK